MDSRKNRSDKQYLSNKHQRDRSYEEETRGKKKKEKVKPLLDQDIIYFPTLVDVTVGSNRNNKRSESNNHKLPTQDFQSLPPWLSKNSLSMKLKGMLKLHSEILDFYNFIKPTKTENEQLEKTYKTIKNIILEAHPNWKVEKFGSFPIGLNLPDSDIDLVILTGKDTDHDKTLKKITSLLFEHGGFSYIEMVKARVPIIKATLKETNVNVDISVDKKNGLEARNKMISILNDFPFMRPIIYFLKYFLRQKKLNETFTGGISSFILFNLVYAYVWYRKKQFHFKENNLLTLGHFLVGFLQFYAFDFNYEDVGIDVRYGCSFYKREKKMFGENNAKGRNLLSLVYFQDPETDLGKSCFKFIKVIDCFKLARDSLYYPPSYPVKSYLSPLIYADDLIQKRKKNNQ